MVKLLSSQARLDMLVINCHSLVVKEPKVSATVIVGVLTTLSKRCHRCLD